MPLTLFVYRCGSADPDICEFETRADQIEAERTLRRIIRSHQRRHERPIYGEPLLVSRQPSTLGASHAL